MRHMKHILLLAIASLMTMGTVYAQEDPPDDPRAMSAEQRHAQREARRAAWENMSDEERAVVREKRDQKMAKRRAERRERFDSMSPEERQAARERMRDRNHHHPGRRGPGQRDGRPRDQQPDAG